MKNHLLIVPALAAAMCACSGGDTPSLYAGIDPDAFDAEIGGKPVALYRLHGSGPAEVAVTNYGGRVVALQVPGRDGQLRDVVLGFDSIQAYLPENNPTDFGASIGRYANRIDRGRLPLPGGDTLQLPVNNFGHTLHGGPMGWQYQVYEAVQPNDSTLVLTIESPDGDNGFPGNVKATVTYTLLPPAQLAIDYEAVTDAPTVVNMTNHSYFNLSGDPSSPVTDHMLSINASGYTPVDSTFMTTGEIEAVGGTPMDFTRAKEIGRDIDVDSEQLRNGMGYDHNWVLDPATDTEPEAAVLYSPSSGIGMRVYTTEPGLQVYTGNFLDGTVTGKGGSVYGKRAAVCLETQHYPDSPNKPQWPSTLLLPGEKYSSRTVYSFYTE